MTNLIAKVSELRKLEAKATPSEWAPGHRENGCVAEDNGEGNVIFRKTGFLPLQENIALICGLRNAAPELLAALGKVQAGDAHKLDEIIEMIDFSIPSELMSVEESDEDFDIAPSEYQEMIQMKATLQRYVDLARLMESSP